MTVSHSERRETTEENSPPGARTSVSGGAKLRLAVNQSHERLGPAPPTDALPASGPAPTRPGHLGWSPGGWRCNRSTAPSSPRNAAPRRFQPQHQPWPPVCAARGLLRFRRWFHPAAHRLSAQRTPNTGTRRSAAQAKHQLANPPTALSSHPAASLTVTDTSSAVLWLPAGTRTRTPNTERTAATPVAAGVCGQGSRRRSSSGALSA